MRVHKEIRSRPFAPSQGAIPVAAPAKPTPRVHARVSHRKSRTGCRVCKIRRVKCDELKPACRRCTSTGRACEGYPELSPSPRASRSPPAELSSFPLVTPSSLSLYRLTFDIPGDQTERRSFSYLRERAIHDISGYFESEFWDRLVLQISHAEPTVRHALLALSSLCETYDTDAISQDIAGNQDRGRMQFALRQYNKAIKLLADDLAKSQPRLDVTLTSCLVFIWLEFMRNNFDAGLSHLKSGLKILEDFRQSGESQGTKRQQIDVSLLRLFAQLDIQATIYGSPTSDFNSETSSTRSEVPMNIPTFFSSIEQARNCLTALMGPVFRFIRNLHDPEFLRTKMKSHPWPDALSLEATSCFHLKQFRKWHAAIRNSPPATFKALDARQSAGLSLLHLYHKTITILLQTLFTQSQMIYDLYDVPFEQVLSLAEHLIQNSQSTGSIIFFDMGVMAPLFYVVLKCRTPALRRRALSLLRLSPRREGMWHRQDVIQYAEWKVNMEESGRGEISETEPLPEEARIWNEQMRDVVIDGHQKTVVRFQWQRNGTTEYGEDVTDLNIRMGQLL